MNVYLVRHAVAVGRSEWDDDDRLRPLTKKGERQSRALVDLLTAPDADVRRVLTSPALRCRETVAPLASKLGLAVDEAHPLAEGAKPKGALALVHDVAADPFDTVLCAHGDLVPEVIRRLGREGMTWDGDLRFAKGSTWVLRFDAGRCVEGRYVPPNDR